MGAGHRMVTKLGPLCIVKLLNNQADKLVVRSPEKAGVGGSTPSLATKSLVFNSLTLILNPIHRADILVNRSCSMFIILSVR